MVVMDYNKIVAALSDEERMLFRQLITSVEKKIAPGLTALTWLTELSDEYIAECSAVTAEVFSFSKSNYFVILFMKYSIMFQLQDFLDDYKNCNLQIVSICEKICDTPMINITPNYTYEILELIKFMYNYRVETITKFVEYYQDIVRHIIVVFEGFENQIQFVNNLVLNIYFCSE